MVEVPGRRPAASALAAVEVAVTVAADRAAAAGSVVVAVCAVWVLWEAETSWGAVSLARRIQWQLLESVE
jgi:hypothetical protein